MSIRVKQINDRKSIRLREEYSENAEFVSKDGFPFNAFDNEWTLNSLGASGQKLNVAFLHDKNWTDELHYKVRIALASLSETLATGTVYRIKVMLNKVDFTNFSLITLQTFIASHKSNLIVYLKALVNKMNELYPLEFTDLHEWLSAQKQHKARRPIYDAEKGALSEFEQQSFERELQIKITKHLETYSASTSKISLIEKLITLRGLIAIRLNYALIRRPINLIQLKWSDIIPVGMVFENNGNQVCELEFSDEKEVQVRIWKAKGKQSFREDAEKYPQRLNTKISAEVFRYRQYYKECLNNHIENIGIKISEKELNALIMSSPVLVSSSLFKTKFSNKKELFKAITKDGSGFHENSDLINSAMKWQLDGFNLKSDRLPILKVGNNRFRHTVGVNANIQLYDALQISKLLGNHQSAAKIYIDLSDEQRANVNSNFIGNALLKRMFDSSIAELREDARFIIQDDFGNEAGQAKSSLSCGKCEETRPLGCYGCDNFQALEDGDHRMILEQAEQKHEVRTKLGEPNFILSKLNTQIKWVRATMIVCNERIEQRRALNEESL
jgi:hypothetical protein